MTKSEFMYDHDYDMIIDLINREIDSRTPVEDKKEVRESSTHEAKDFFKL